MESRAPTGEINISAAKAVYREFKYTNNSEISIFLDFSDFLIFLIFYGVPEVREVSRKLPGARGFVVIEYEPVASHGDPIQARFYKILTLLDVHPSRFINVFLEKMISYKMGQYIIYT